MTGIKRQVWNGRDEMTFVIDTWHFLLLISYLSFNTQHFIIWSSRSIFWSKYKALEWLYRRSLSRKEFDLPDEYYNDKYCGKNSYWWEDNRNQTPDAGQFQMLDRKGQTLCLVGIGQRAIWALEAGVIVLFYLKEQIANRLGLSQQMFHI